ncbi:MAG: hypothetical protein ACE5I7_13435 [Candidatus Binatia bacterium]
MQVMSPQSPYERLRRQLEATDPLVVEAADEVDVALIDWALSLSPWERLRASSEALDFLSRFHRVTSQAR